MTLVIDNNAVARLVGPLDVIDALDAAYRAQATGEGICAPRLDFQSPERPSGETYQLGLAIGLSTGGYGCVRIKSDIVFQSLVDGRPRKEKYCLRPGSYMGLLLVFETATGALRAIIHDGLIQGLRVGADSALGVRYMARPDARRLGILGAGGMAGSHLAAIAAIRSLERVRIFSPTSANREALAAHARDALGLDAEAVDRADAVFEGADLLAACTNAIGPVVSGSRLAPGMHVTAIGGTLDPAASARVDVALRFGTATAPAEASEWAVEDECLTFAAGDKPAHGGTRRFHTIPPERRVMFADLLAEPGRGRTDPGQITFSERGNIHGIQFAALAGLIYERARDAGLGTPLDDALFLQSIRN